MGSFYFARHPDYLPNFYKTASGLFAVNTISGLALYFSNNSKAGNRGTVRRHRVNNTVSRDGIRYIDEDVFIKHYPGAIAEEGSSYQLSMEEVNNLPLNK